MDFQLSLYQNSKKDHCPTNCEIVSNHLNGINLVDKVREQFPEANLKDISRKSSGLTVYAVNSQYPVIIDEATARASGLFQEKSTIKIGCSLEKLKEYTHPKAKYVERYSEYEIYYVFDSIQFAADWIRDGFPTEI